MNLYFSLFSLFLFSDVSKFHYLPNKLVDFHINRYYINYYSTLNLKMGDSFVTKINRNNS
jgi:hypothetical protein